MAMLAVLVIYFAFIAVFVAGIWKVFSKAGHPGWMAIIPILNIYIMCKIAGRPGWWLLLLFIPIVSFVISIIVLNDISRSFGRGIGTTVGLIFLSPVFFCILGFGSAQYQGPAAA
jgi:uncharacterized membrane protein YoaK (UPF0700 family)